MRICSPQLGVAPYSILGGEIYDREVLKRLARAGIKVDIVLPYGKPFEKVKNWHIIYEPIPFVVPPHLYNFFVLPYLFYLYKKRPFDILRIHSPTFLGLAAAVFKKIYPQVPIVGTYHWLGEGGAIERFIDPYLINNVFDLVICDSFYTKKQLEKQYKKVRGKIHAIHNGVDERLKPASKPSSLMRKYGISSSTITLLFMGLFIDRKNPLFLLDFIHSLVRKNDTIKLLLCGKGLLENEIKKQIHNRGLTNSVFIVPPVFNNEKRELLNLADIFVHPAKQEGFSLAVIEAMACGLPIIINDGFSAREAIENGKNGFLCNVQNDWIKYINRLIINAAMREKIKENNIIKVRKEFTWNRTVDQQLALFNSLLNK